MSRYRQVLLTYMTRRLMLVLGAALLMGIGMLLNKRNGTIESQIVFLPRLLMTVAFPVFLIGIHLKQQIASPRASLMPGYRVPHLIVAGLLIACFLGLSLVGVEELNWQLPGIFAVALYAISLSLHLGARPGFVSVLLYVFAVLVPIVPHLRAVMVEMLAGREPWLAWSLLSANVAWLALLVDHLMKLTEDDPDYGRVQPMHIGDLRAATVRNQLRTQMSDYKWWWDWALASSDRRLAAITSKPAVTLWQRISLLRIGEYGRTNLWAMVLIVAAAELFILYLARSELTTDQHFRSALSLPLLFSFTLPWAQWITWIMRWPRLGYESLRPATRQQWVIENALALLTDLGRYLSLWLILQVVLLFVFLRQFSESPVLWEAAAFCLCGQVFSFGACALVASFRYSVMTLIAQSLLLVTVMTPWFLSSAWRDQNNSGAAVELILGAVGGVLGLIFGTIAFRRWCSIDLP